MSKSESAVIFIMALGLTAVTIGLYKLVEWLLNNWINTAPSLTVFIFIIYLLFLAICIKAFEEGAEDNN